MKPLAFLILLLASAAHAAEIYRGVRVAPEVDCPTYDGDNWRYPRDADIRYGLRMADGRYFSPYDGAIYGSEKDLDIEHLRSRHSAAKAGGCHWPKRAKRAYASDPLNLTVAPPGINQREKSDKDPDRWLPDENQYWFAWRYLLVSQKYGLTITPETREVLEGILGD